MRVTIQTGIGVAGHHFICRTAADGIYLSSHFGESGGLRDVFEHRPGGDPIKSLTFTTNAPWEWKTPVCIDFFSVEPPVRSPDEAG